MKFTFKSGQTLDFSSTSPMIMGILNVTPDSFTGDGIYKSIDNAVDRAAEMLRQGAAIIDVGGESTRPNAETVGADEEAARVVPVIEAIAKRFDTVISVDTYKASVARQAMNVGADIINDISGLTLDDKMLETAADTQATVVVTYCGSYPKISWQSDNDIRPNFLRQTYEFCSKQIGALNAVGVSQVIVDIGLGFDKSLNENYYLLKNLEYFKSLNKPLLVGLSRKSMIGKVVGDSDRLGPTVMLDGIAINNGASIIRVHDVEQHCSMIKVLTKYNSL